MASFRTTRGTDGQTAAEQEPPGQHNIAEQDIGVRSQHMPEELRVLAQPGAMIATLAVLLLMAAGDAAIFGAVKGWPF
ncbi:hypothetical protein [Bradyrhizobium sp. 141]|uniref:hypothetical protein n=1 Tax=Bradyrhizobium sp. 141 TaxID=2782617 RepID=UPI001FFBD637|nr:hypothetical protein [Bradyrhizobium sp. 141]MCK1718158.1 hypothetical protein [Bradyrhizobium sp. 141]